MTWAASGTGGDSSEGAACLEVFGIQNNGPHFLAMDQLRPVALLALEVITVAAVLGDSAVVAEGHRRFGDEHSRPWTAEECVVPPSFWRWR